MKVVELSIENFRGIEQATLSFSGHTLLIGPNNVGKSTICEAIDLVLAPDRLARLPPIEEFDFYNGRYLAPSSTEGDPPAPVKIRIELTLIELSAEIQRRCQAHIEFWHIEEKRILNGGEARSAAPGIAVPCLRLETVGQYDPGEDEFSADTYFTHSPNAPAGEKETVHRYIKRLFGFLYLRALRTGTRALSLERGSLLDVLLRLQNIRTGLWEHAIAKLKELDLEPNAPELQQVLEDIENRLASYVPCTKVGRKTRLSVSQLTREHLRKTMAFFLAVRTDQDPVPFQQAGAGTLNTLVLALLSFIGDLKPDSLIFAMEEPEIAVQPHIQRRIADYLLHHTRQAFVTSHSPYIIERFEPDQTFILKREGTGGLSATCLADVGGLKKADYRRFARRGLAECMLGNGVILVEGATEAAALPIVARLMEGHDPQLNPLDLAGISFFDVEGDGQLAKFGHLFRTLDLKVFGFYDHKDGRSQTESDRLASALDINFEHQYSGFEQLLATEISVARLRSFLEDIIREGEGPSLKLPSSLPADDTKVKELVQAVLANRKGAGYAARLLEQCPPGDLPSTVLTFLRNVYSAFPLPAANIMARTAGTP